MYFGGLMETVTYFLNEIWNQNLSDEQFQNIDMLQASDCDYNSLSISGCKISDSIFENVTFTNCTFWASSISNTLFINCLFVNCKFQFTNFSDCNFEFVLFETCTWGVSKINGENSFVETLLSKNKNFESSIPNDQTRSLTLNEILLSA